MPKNHKETIGVIGGGIAGVCTSELLCQRGYKVKLFEKHKSLGGCAGSFIRNDFKFNVGATTVAGLQPEFPVYKILSSLDTINCVDIKNPGLVVYTPKGKVKRFLNLEQSTEEIERVFPHKNNKNFWKTVYDVTFKVLCHDYYHSFASPRDSIKTFYNMKGLIMSLYRHFLIPAKKGLNEYFPQIDRDYYDFMDAHVKIVAQSSIEDVSLLTLFLSLGYPFTAVGYSTDGMGSLIGRMIKNTDIFLKSEINSIKMTSDGYVIRGNFGEENFCRLILAFPLLENLKVLENRRLIEYFQKYSRLNSDNSAFVVYGVIEDFSFEENFNLVLISSKLPYTTSKYLFFSFNDPTVNSAREKYVSFTISTHTSTKYWIDLEREVYDKRKEDIMNLILDVMSDCFKVQKEKIIISFASTPESFYRYLNRRSVGGIPVKRQNPFWRIPSNFTPFKGLYLAGDSFFSYQGWLGISMGIWNLINNWQEKI